MQGRFISCLAVCLTALPAFVSAQQGTTPEPKAATVGPVVTSKVVSVPVNVSSINAPPVVPVPAPTTALAGVPAAATSQPEITVNIGGQAPRTGGLAPLPKAEFDLPAGLIPPAPISPPAPAPQLSSSPGAPPTKLTPTQIAQQIAPNFNVARDYVRLTQCYGVADFMGAVTRIQASRPGATSQIVGVARSIATLQEAMQPMVLAASTVRTEARFRADYDAIARRGQSELATSRTPNVTMQRRLASLDACRADVVRWRGGR